MPIRYINDDMENAEDAGTIYREILSTLAGFHLPLPVFGNGTVCGGLGRAAVEMYPEDEEVRTRLTLLATDEGYIDLISGLSARFSGDTLHLSMAMNLFFNDRNLDILSIDRNKLEDEWLFYIWSGSSVLSLVIQLTDLLGEISPAVLISAGYNPDVSYTIAGLICRYAPEILDNNNGVYSLTNVFRAVLERHPGYTRYSSPYIQQILLDFQSFFQDNGYQIPAAGIS